MKIERVEIVGFGPLADEAIDFADGMTVVFGPNESAKSALHAATYAALCGMRRGRGQPRSEDREFAAQHRPWDGRPWQVRSRIQLADGREIELTHSLDGRVACRAQDMLLGRDVSSEIIVDGAPDGSRWLGFDRASFLATACVRQAEIAAVLHHAGALQDEIQRAAATAGRDETAAEAIERLRVFQREQVGRDITNSTKPLRRAIEAVGRAERHLEEARHRHDEYLEVLGKFECLERRRGDAATRLRAAEAVIARADAAALAARLSRARELSARHSQQPTPLAEVGELADAVAQALALWEAAPAEPDLSGQASRELEAALEALPEPPQGDVEPAQQVVAAEGAHAEVERLIFLHREQEPPPAPTSSTELHRLADSLAVAPAVDRSLRWRVEQPARAGASARLRRTPLALGAAVLVAGLVAAMFRPVVGAPLIVVGLMIAAVSLWNWRHSSGAHDESLSAAERLLAEQEEEARLAEERRREARTRVAALGLPAESQALRDAAVSAARREEWESRLVALEAQRDDAAGRLRDALAERGVDADADLGEALARYKRKCAERKSQREAAGQRPELERLLSERRTAERSAAQRSAARDGLLAAARCVGVPGGDPEDVAEGLREWQARRAEELEVHERALAEWEELQGLLAGMTLDELAAEAERALRAAEERTAGLDDAELARLDPEQERQRLRLLRDAVAEAACEADGLRGRAQEMARSVPSVAEAEEEFDSAQAELDRVRALEQTLSRTVAFLEAAQDRVHRDIAPVLRETLEHWLPRVAVQPGGNGSARYVEARVDPATLRVEVRACGGEWRDAAYLSEGTKEQIFLLLRVALAEHLTVAGEKAPLILDEVTAQCDAHRRRALLDLLHELSSDRQVILFTHDEGALAWARETLDLESGRDRLVTREPVPAA